MHHNNSILLLLCVSAFLIVPAAAFGAGDIPHDHGLGMYVWRHGDIAQLLLSLPASFTNQYAFSELEKRQIYFGNWLRDLSQVVDTAMLENVSEEVLRTIVSILGFMHFGLATDDFSITKERLGCYSHVEHIDNPKGYPNDAKKIDERLRGPVRDEELEIDPNTGLKNYIANSGKGWDTSADYIKAQLRLSIARGREGRQTNNESAMADAFRHLGAALHTLEDFPAHSNFIELCLVKLGVEDVFAYVGESCKITCPGSDQQIAPLVTGTFGMLDALQSIIGEADDRAIMITRGELGALDDMMDVGGMAFETVYTVLRRSAALLASISSRGGDILSDLEKVNVSVTSAQQDPSKYDPEKNQDKDMAAAIWEAVEPAFRVHDNISKWLLERRNLIMSEALQKAADQIERYIDTFVYSSLASIIEPLVKQVRNAVKKGRKSLLEEEKNSQEMSEEDGKKSEHVLQPGSSDSNPSHSLIAKDHFSNLLNRPSGLIAGVTTNWTTQQIVRCWDDASKNMEDTLDEIVKIMHHPHFASDSNFIQLAMSECVKQWWEEHSKEEQDKVQHKLSKSGIEQDLNNDHNVTEASFEGKRKGFAEFHGSRPSLIARPEKDLGVADALNAAAQSLGLAVPEPPTGILGLATMGIVNAAWYLGSAVGLTSGPKTTLDAAAVEEMIGRKPSAEILALLEGYKQGKITESEFMGVLARQKTIAEQEN